MERYPDGKDQVLVPTDLAESFEPIIGQAVTLRPLRRDDIDIEAAFLAGLSPESRHNRLLGGMIQITREYLERLTTVDFSRDMALAAVLMLEGREVLIGVARYVLEADGRACEFAIVIADAWQGRRIGRRMIDKLVVVARGAGLSDLRRHASREPYDARDDQEPRIPAQPSPRRRDAHPGDAGTLGLGVCFQPARAAASFLSSTLRASFRHLRIRRDRALPPAPESCRRRCCA